MRQHVRAAAAALLAFVAMQQAAVARCETWCRDGGAGRHGEARAADGSRAGACHSIARDERSGGARIAASSAVSCAHDHAARAILPERAQHRGADRPMAVPLAPSRAAGRDGAAPLEPVATVVAPPRLAAPAGVRPLRI